MAKLNGVKTLDMVNGEITKVAYGGAEYVKAEGLPKKGDLVRAEEGGYDITYGAFYKITDDADHADDVRFLDDVDFGRVRFGDDYELFRKVAACTDPSLEERVSSAEGEIEALKSDMATLKGEAGYVRIDKSEAQEGDYIKFDEAPRTYLTAGEYYEIDYVDSHGDPQITDDDGDEFDTYSLDHCEFEVYRKVSAASVEVEPKPERLKVGDYAKVVGQAIVTEKGEIVKVIQDTGAIIPFKVETMDGKYTEWRSEASLVRATDEEVAEAKDEAARAKFKKGAKVRLLSGGGKLPLIGFKNGKIYEVSDNNFDHPRRGKRIRIEGGDCFRGSGCATPDQLEILTEEEVAEIERKQAEEAKWAKIGRKVGEYKRGDIARVVDNKCAGRVANGDIIEVLKQASGGSVVDTVHGYFLKVELITPVEARFDR
ncbi:hypothetical protein [Bacillus velezensis]|nr:hypothetical protein [Bacillus velezensis]URD63475.1 hypothetical protein M8X21_15910 [Bacillus velezensis]WED87121.1 hypothetical protein PXG99_20040 [Bacillus velezensis]WFB54701.1 hypothetical protein P0M29_07620 [Bacillus velezensis]